MVRALAPCLEGRRIRRAEFFSQLILRHDPGKIAERMRGRRIAGVERHGKFIVVRLDRGVLVIHLGMTGKLLVNGEPGAYTRAIFTLDRGRLLFDDIRMFGSIECHDAVPARVARLGPEPLLVSLPEFVERMKGRKTPVKSLLLNQGFLRGVGNIYADEALFRAHIHPRTVAGRIRPARAERLHAGIQEVLRQAIAAGGSSISDYVNLMGEQGWFQMELRVYGRDGEACVDCGTPVRRIVLGGRGTHYCPKCQR